MKTKSLLIVLFVYLAAIGFFLSASEYSVSGFPLDDAYIHAVYSRSFAHLKGFQYNEGVQEAGSTSPLWAIVSAPAERLEPFGEDAVIIGIKAIGTILGLGCIIFIYLIIYEISGSKPAAFLTALVFSIEPIFLFSALSGMETALLVFLMLGAFYCLLTERLKPALVLIGLLPVTRPEAAVILPLFILMAYLKDSLYRRPFIRQLFLCLIPLVPLLLWFGYCFSITGHIFPNTFYLKSKGLSLGIKEIILSYQLLTLHGYGSLYIFLPGIFLLAIYFAICIKNLKNILTAIFLIFVPIIYLLSVVGTREMRLDGYYWLRWADPASLILYMGSITGNVLFFTGNTICAQKSRVRAIFAIAGIAALLFSMPDFSKTFSERKSRFASDSRSIHIMNVQAGMWISGNTDRNAVIGTNDAGAIKYFGKRKTIDFIGLNNKEIAFNIISRPEAMKSADYLTLSSSWIKVGGNEAFFFKYFDKVNTFQLPVDEYTVCDCPDQAVRIILKRK